MTITWRHEREQTAYDGDGMRLRLSQAVTADDGAGGETQPEVASAYELRSTVLGGAVATTITEGGTRGRGYVYLGGEMLAWQAAEGAQQVVRWSHRDASGASFRVSVEGGGVDASQSAEADALGQDAGLRDPYAAGVISRKVWTADYWGGGQSADVQCRMDFMVQDCATVLHLTGAGAAAQCPDNDCGPRSVIYQGRRTSAIFRAYADGYQGYVPVTAGYVGTGYFVPHTNSPPRLERREEGFDTNFAALNGATGERQLGRIPDWNLQDITGAEKQKFVNDIREIVSKPACNDFFKELFSVLKELHPNEPPAADDMLSMLDVVNSQEGFVRVGNSRKLLSKESGYYSTVSGSSYRRNAAALINSAGGVALQDVLSILHEVMHVAGRGYNDRALAEAAFQGRKHQGLLTTGVHQLPEDATNVDANSRYWNKYLVTACNPELNR